MNGLYFTSGWNIKTASLDKLGLFLVSYLDQDLESDVILISNIWDTWIMSESRKVSSNKSSVYCVYIVMLN